MFPNPILRSIPHFFNKKMILFSIPNLFDIESDTFFFDTKTPSKTDVAPTAKNGLD